MIKLPLALYEAITEKDLKAYKDIKKKDLGNVNIKLGNSVEGIYNTNDKDKVMVKHVDLESKIEGIEEFDYLISTIPFPNLKRIDISDSFSNEKLRAIEEISFKNSQKVYLYVKERFWEMGGKSKRIIGGKTITDLPLYSIYYPSDHIEYEDKSGEVIKLNGNPKESGILLASYSTGDKAKDFSFIDDEIKIKDTIKYIEKIHNLPKGYLDSILLDYKSLVWSDIQYIWGFSTLFKPEDKILYSYIIFSKL
ncbi:hypothetical protein SDC9_163696 [bioreactor metagenome]|uniref:Amine oxidase domain-containing protein n=1 Tax=bioreactor metagenome TaxID=1076179 RepID=A0A645FPK5_9ZZZZ